MGAGGGTKFGVLTNNVEIRKTGRKNSLKHLLYASMKINPVLATIIAYVSTMWSRQEVKIGQIGKITIKLGLGLNFHLWVDIGITYIRKTSVEIIPILLLVSQKLRFENWRLSQGQLRKIRSPPSLSKIRQ